MCAARQSHDEPSTLGDRLAGLFAGRAVRVVSALALLVAVLVGGTLLWRRFQPLVDDDPRYRLAAENIHVTPQPDFIRSTCAAKPSCWAVSTAPTSGKTT